MKIDEANAIPMPEILKNIGVKPVRRDDIGLLYKSPLHGGKLPSLRVNTEKNTWEDIKIDKRGKLTDFVMLYLASRHEDHTLADALRWIDNMRPQKELTLPLEISTRSNTPFMLRRVSALQHGSLLNYLQVNGIPDNLGQRYLKEIVVHAPNLNKDFYALGLQNIDGGWEFRNKVLRGSIAPNGISFIRGPKSFPNTIHLFKNFMDFLSALAAHQVTDLGGDVIILNSYANLPRVAPYIKNYSYKKLQTWFDNTKAGVMAVHALNSFAIREGTLAVSPMNILYAGHKDVGAWHRVTLGL